ncbi:hypothetical protein JD844_010173 [Phrynosoma platyrhinos]|uniref:Uncharacterized protein n=1 Tax=Phrynosoma platyrhinos TaxID=52577 RepID=A0ABQ7TG51_PHRPL|nr:hypothetical protein JD844_010173 [Phrynosoma platyrhinos]
MACCLQIPESQALNFLQETAQLLSQPGPTNSNTAIHGPTVPHSYRGCFPEGAQTFGPLDTLSLISFHCSSLEPELGVGTSVQEWDPIVCAKDHGGHHLWAACLEEPQTAQLPGISVPHKSESPRGGTRRVSRKHGKLRKRRVPLAKEEGRTGSSEEEEGCLSTHSMFPIFFEEINVVLLARPGKHHFGEMLKMGLLSAMPVALGT